MSQPLPSLPSQPFDPERHVEPPRLSAQALDVWRKAKKNGWSIVCAQSDEGKSNWAYTVGLWSKFNHPEILISALSQPASVSILNALGQMVRQGRSFEVTGNQPGILKGLPARFSALNTGVIATHMRMVEVFEPIWMTRAIEIIWPDKNGVFFDEPGFLSAHAGTQLLLSERPDHPD